MGAFATLKKIGFEFNLNFVRVVTLEKAGFHKVYQKKNWVPAQKKMWVVATLYFFKFMP